MSELSCLREIPWETRNLGRKSFAVTDAFIESPDTELLALEIRRSERDFGPVFIQARLAKGSTKAGLLLQDLGFYFVETALVPHCVLAKNGALRTFMNDRGSFVPARYDAGALAVCRVRKDDEDLCKTVKGIAEESFSDDRFHLDPHCSDETADRRYSYWVEEMLDDREIAIYLLLLSGKAIAFMARKGPKLLLAGFSKKYVKCGLGDFLWLSVLEQMLAENLPHAETMISANNVPVMNLYTRIGFKFKEPAATFHYWSNRSETSPAIQ